MPEALRRPSAPAPDQQVARRQLKAAQVL